MADRASVKSLFEQPEYYWVEFPDRGRREQREIADHDVEVQSEIMAHQTDFGYALLSAANTLREGDL
jgi:hypothetical protein